MTGQGSNPCCSEMKLLSRDQFREAVFTRDYGKCVFCGEPAVDAHHILERRLFPDHGYYLDNGASVCEADHIKCEQTLYSVEEVRAACRIVTKVLPPGFDPDAKYDKWGNEYIREQRIRGPLFYDESVQKILRPYLGEFLKYVKYPRTPHIPTSPGRSKDDKVLPSMDHFWQKRLIITTKMDGENTTIYNDYIHARSIDSKHHDSRDHVKAWAATWQTMLPEGWRVCGENLYAKHSIKYTDLPAYFLGFSMWDNQTCLSWDDTIEMFQLLGIEPVKVIYDGFLEDVSLERLAELYKDQEGFVIRIADAFDIRDFKLSVAKYVRKNHVTTDNHWMHQKVERNLLKQLDT